MPVDTNGSDFKAMMQTVNVLRTHYSRVAGAGEHEMIAARMRGDAVLAKKYRDLLDKMREDHRAALQLIGERVTTPDQLRDTRKALRSAADAAHGFVQSLKDSVVTLSRLAEAAKFLTDLLGTLTVILG